jgi:predicted kinase
METKMNKTLLALHGLPRSGKSTICETLRKRLGAPVVRRDAIRLALHGQRYLSEAEPMVKAMSLYMIRSLFEAGHEVIVCDETNYSLAARNSLRDPGWFTIFYPVDTPPEVCIERAIATGQPDLIPIIKNMHLRHEPLQVWEEKFADITTEGTIVSMTNT